MEFRKYSATVTVTLMSPEGEDMGTVSEVVSVDVDMSEFSGEEDANKCMKDELSTMLSAAAFNVENCMG